MIPHERSLVKKLEGKPFALIGINTDSNKNDVKKKSKEMQVTWRSFFDGSTSGKICKAWRVTGFPTICIVDHKGVVRYKNLRGEAMEEAVEKLLKELEAEKSSS